MTVDVIDNQSQFFELKKSWDKLYALDNHLSIHRSWMWIDSWIHSTNLRWFILVVRSTSGEAIAILPLARDENIHGVVKYVLAGYPISAHTGLICHPDYEAYALRKLAKYLIRNNVWDKLIFLDGLDARLHCLISSFNKVTYSIDNMTPTPCPFINLPKSWEEYLQNNLGYKSRSDARNLIKRLDDLTDFNLVIATESNIHEYLEITLHLWTERWGDNNIELIKLMRDLICNSMSHNILRLAVYMDGPIVFASIVSWLDKVKKEYNAFLFCFNKEYSVLKSPGKAAIFNEIRFAINEEYSLFNFGRGDEDYKNRFGIDVRMNSNYTVSRKTWRQIAKSILLPYTILK